MDEKEMKKKYMEYQMLDQQIKQLQEQMQLVEQQSVEVMAAVQSIEEFSNLKDGSEMLVPLNNGIFAKARLVKEDKLRVNVGAGVVVDKSITETKKLIEKQSEEMEKVRVAVAQNVDQMVQRAAEIEKEMSSQNV